MKKENEKSCKKQKRWTTKRLQQAFLEELPRCNFRIKPACEKVGIGRTIVYRWRSDDAEFQEQLRLLYDDWKDTLIAVAYDEAVVQRNTTVLIKMLETFCRDRGFGRDKPESEKNLSVSQVNVTIVHSSSLP